MTLPALEITEKWIRKRVGLEHENLEDVKSLALPGTYHEKITHLGTSLLGFNRLKSLDLSRNGLVSLSGLAHLNMLERLNLYYNNIQTLDDIHLLKHNSNLQELDLRLNPVTKTEVDYRLFVIHLLPNLRKLDDRSVRDGERNSAILHFDTDQANEMMSHGADQVHSEQSVTQSLPSSRTEQIRKLGRYPSALDDDDNALIDLLAKTGGDLNKPYPLSGSQIKSSTYQPYPKEDIRKMESRVRRPANLDVASVDRVCRDASIVPSLRGGSPQSGSALNGSVESPGSSQYASPHEYTNRGQYRGQVQFKEADSRTEEELSKFKDEADAYTSFTSKGYFTPNPNLGSESPTVHTPPKQSVDGEQFKEPPHVQRMFEAPSQGKEESRSPLVKDAADDLLKSLLHVVDRYWNGSKSLHYHSKFQAQARHLIKSAFLQNLATHRATSPARDAEERAQRLEAENRQLREEVEVMRSEEGQTGSERDMHILQGKLEESLEKYSLLQRELMKTREQNGVIHPQPSGAGIGSREDVESLWRDNEKLQFQIKHYKQLQELASMLQESHKSLVTTNDHLLKEMEELKRRHLQEVKQLHWSYKEMKNTMKVISHPDQNHNPL